jgi:hypothetical protein
MTPLLHNYSNATGQTRSWDTSDSEERFLKNLQDPNTRQKLQELGYLHREISYTFNSHGFRTKEFDSDIDIVCFGCSFTMGTGVKVEDTWPMQVQSLTGMQVANLGHAGSSNDTAFRFARHYLHQLRPRYAVWLQTDKHRLELIDESVPASLNILASDTANPCANDVFIKTWFGCDKNQDLNLEKNTLAFEKICESLEIKYKIISRQSVESDSCARDLIHPSPQMYKNLAKQVADWLG